MNKHEIALQLTLSAINSGNLKPVHSVSKSADDAGKNNNIFAKEITDFYNYVFDNIHCKP